jgi:hypothetical protein
MLGGQHAAFIPDSLSGKVLLLGWDQGFFEQYLKELP